MSSSAPRKNTPKAASLCVAREGWPDRVGIETRATLSKIALSPLSTVLNVIFSATIIPGMTDLFGPQTKESGVSRVSCERLLQETSKFHLQLRTTENLGLWTE